MKNYAKDFENRRNPEQGAPDSTDREMRRVWDEAERLGERLPEPPPIDEALAGLQRKMADHRLAQSRTSVWRGRSRFAWLVTAGAAAVVLLFVFFPSDATTRYETLPGETKSLTLPDGSHVHMGPASRLRVEMGGDTRNLTLTGRALFDVRRSDRAFVVNTDWGRVRVLGTVFNVESGQAGFEVGVVEGRVRVSLAATSDTVDLSPGRVLRLGAGESDTGRRLLDLPAADYPHWRHHVFEFHETPLNLVLARIGTHYGIQVRIADPGLANRVLSGRFQGEDPHALLAGMATLLGARVEVEAEGFAIHQ